MANDNHFFYYWQSQKRAQHIYVCLFNPLKHDISPCNINAFFEQSDRENWGHDHTRWILLYFKKLFPLILLKMYKEHKWELYFDIRV